jgi:hypothetical protein
MTVLGRPEAQGRGQRSGDQTLDDWGSGGANRSENQGSPGGAFANRHAMRCQSRGRRMQASYRQLANPEKKIRPEKRAQKQGVNE